MNKEFAETGKFTVCIRVEDCGSRMPDSWCEQASDLEIGDLEEDEIQLAGLKDALAVAIIAFCILYFSAYFVPLERELMSFGHLQFLNGSVLIKASHIRNLHFALLVLAAVGAEVVCSRTGNYDFSVLLFAVMLTVILCMGSDLFLLNREAKMIPLPDKYHKQYEELWERDPWIIYPEKGLREQWQLEVDGENYLYRMNYGGMFRNDFAFRLDREKAEIRIPVDGNKSFIRRCLGNWDWQQPDPVTAAFYTAEEPYRALQFQGWYDGEREEFVIPFTDSALEGQYGYCVVRLNGTVYESHQLFGERPAASY